MRLNLNQNHFELFGLSAGFEVDGETLALRYRDLQKETHPDRFANASDQERRLSVQLAAQINEAYRVLKNPLARARYLLELNGVNLDDTDTRMDPEFLMEQMELREALAEIPQAKAPFDALDELRDQLEARERDLIEDLRRDFDDGSTPALARARDVVRKMQFIQRLLEEAETLEENLVHQEH
ncbi:MAG TPA: Fe-S protein assembly co-chaperone HscB [Gammaproteobacteria bacterium]